MNDKYSIRLKTLQKRGKEINLVNESLVANFECAYYRFPKISSPISIYYYPMLIIFPEDVSRLFVNKPVYQHHPPL